MNDTNNDFYDLLCSRVGGDFTYANIAVKAHFAARLAPTGMEFWLRPDPALESDHTGLIRLYG